MPPPVIVDRESSTAQEGDDGAGELEAGLIAADRDRPDIGDRNERRIVCSGPPSSATVIRRSLSVSWASGVT